MLKNDEACVDMTSNVYYQDSSITLEKKSYVKGYVMPWHKHDFLSISLMVEGELVEKCHGDTLIPQTGFLSIKPEKVVHQDIFVTECTFLSLKVHDVNYYSMGLDQWKWIRPSTAIKHFINIIQQRNKREAIKDFAYFLNEACKKNCKQEIVPQWLKHVHKVVTEHYNENWQIQELARDVNKHPFYVARLFKHYYGIDILAYKNNLKLHHALSDVLNRNGNLTTLAHQHGFSDQSHFCREFKKATAVTAKKATALFQV